MIELEDMCIDYKTVLRDALVKMDKNAQGLLFVVDDLKLLGVITDGDVRRAMISGKTVDEPLTEIYNPNFKYLNQTASAESIQESLSDKIKVIPLVDNRGNIVDFSSIYRLHRIPVLEPLLGGNELQYVTECIKTNWISSQGKYVKKFEDEVKAYTGSKYALAVSNGTVALHLALVSLGIGSGDEVIVPDITFGATLNAVVLAGAKPVIIDVDTNTYHWVSPSPSFGMVCWRRCCCRANFRRSNPPGSSWIRFSHCCSDCSFSVSGSPPSVGTISC